MNAVVEFPVSDPTLKLLYHGRTFFPVNAQRFSRLRDNLPQARLPISGVALARRQKADAAQASWRKSEVPQPLARKPEVPETRVPDARLGAGGWP